MTILHNNPEFMAIAGQELDRLSATLHKRYGDELECVPALGQMLTRLCEYEAMTHIAVATNRRMVNHTQQYFISGMRRLVGDYLDAHGMDRSIMDPYWSYVTSAAIDVANAFAIQASEKRRDRLGYMEMTPALVQRFDKQRPGSVRLVDQEVPA